MAMSSIVCRVSGSYVVRVTDFGGHIQRVFCPGYEPATGGCRFKESALEGGPVSLPIECRPQDALDGRRGQCELQMP
jgi:hypothetical protein